MEPGTLIDEKYEVRRLLGRGGMGEVYEVEHRLTKRRLALKVLQRGWQHDAALVERFFREAQAAGRVGNPHLVEVTDAGRLPDGMPWLVMELLAGQSLAELLERSGRLPLEAAVELVSQACVGVQAAHDAGIVHRDLKPENLFVTERNGRPFVKLLDFGVSKFHALEADAGLTASQTILGTPRYMAPEQMSHARGVDGRADLYSLAVITYELLTGRPPYDAASFAALAVLVMRGGAPPVVSLRAEVPATVSGVIQQAMAVKPADRPGTAREFSELLVRASAARGSLALDDTVERQRPMTHGSQSLRALPWLLVGVLSFAVVFLAGRLSVTTASPPPLVSSASPADAAVVVATSEPRSAPVVEAPHDAGPARQPVAKPRPRPPLTGVAAEPQVCEDRTACVSFDWKLVKGITCGNWGEARARVRNDCAEAVKCRFFWLDVPGYGNHAHDLFTLRPGAELGGGIDGAYACYQAEPPVPGRRAHACATERSPDSCVPRAPAGSVATSRPAAPESPPAPLPTAPRLGPATLTFVWDGPRSVSWNLKEREKVLRWEETRAGKPTVLDVAPGRYVLRPTDSLSFAPIELELGAGERRTVTPVFGEVRFEWTGARRVEWRVRAASTTLYPPPARPGEPLEVALAPGSYQLEAMGSLPAFLPLAVAVEKGAQLRVAPRTGQLHFTWSGAREVDWVVMQGDTRLGLQSTRAGETRVVDLPIGTLRVQPSSLQSQAFRPFTLEVKPGGVHQVHPQ